MPRTIANSYSSGIYLAPSDSPVVVTDTGTINPSVATLYALGGAGATSWDIDNSGTISNDVADSGIQSAGVILGTHLNAVTSAVVTNELNGVISAAQTGVYIYGPGSVTNVSGGTITGTNFSGIQISLGAGTVINQGVVLSNLYGVSEGRGVSDGNAGSVTNLSGGIITGTTGDGVNIGLGQAAVVNAGSIYGGSAGIYEFQAGSITNQNGGVINGGSYGVNNYYGGYVANQLGGTIVGNTTAIYIEYHGTGTITNSGTLLGGTYGVKEGGGGSVTNDVSGTIVGTAGAAIYVGDGPGTIVNAGSLVGTYGISDRSGGTVTNQSGGTITGTANDLILLDGGTSRTVVNQGYIYSSSHGVNLDSGGTVINLLGGTIVGNQGVQIASGRFTNYGVVLGGAFGAQLGAGSTVTNAGTISGGVGAVSIAAGGPVGASRVIVDPGAVFIGSVIGDQGVMGLASTASKGTISGFNGSSITNFASLTFDQDAQWTVTGNSAGLGALGGITGFTINDTIEVTGVVADTATYGSGVLTLSKGAVTKAVLNITGDFSSSDFQLTNDGSNTFLTEGTACYRTGTRILTPSGEAPIETLAIGDLVVTRSGEAKPIRWIGRRGYRGRFIAGNRDVLPIRIAAGALGDGVPKRDLDVSPGHAMLFDEGFVPADRLFNGGSIRQLEAVDSVEYIHIELAAHDAIFAEGALSETYVECDNRGRFANADEFAELYPDVEVPKRAYCAPRIEDGKVLAEIRRRLDARLDACGCATTLDPELRLVVDGCEVLPDVVQGRVHLFRLARPAEDVRIVSRSSIPAGSDGSVDTRRLGVSLSSLVLRCDGATIMIEHDHAALTDGFHQAEMTHRWTDGNARIPPAFLACFARGVTIEVRTMGLGLRYRSGWRGEAEAA